MHASVSSNKDAHGWFIHLMSRLYRLQTPWKNKIPASQADVTSLWHAPGCSFSNDDIGKAASYHTIPTSSKIYKTSKLLQNNYVHLLGNIPYHFSLYFLFPLSSKYSPQHPILRHPQPAFLLQYQRPSFTPIQNSRQKYSSVYFKL